MGNGGSATIDVAALFGDAAKVVTVWKWVAAQAAWAFYTPLANDGGAAYAAIKGYQFANSINGGEGFWVNAKTGFAVQLPAGTAIASTSFQTMAPGWNLIAVGDAKTPSQFNRSLSATSPPADVIPLNLTTLWAWDAMLSNWYFYAPSLEQSGGLPNYVQSKGYLDFGTNVLTSTTGFWVNKP